MLWLWFIAETKLDWAQDYPRDPQLIQQLEIEVLLSLSMAKVQEMLKALLPLNQLSPGHATHAVIQHLVNRSHSTRSRLKTKQGKVHNLKRPI